MTQQEIKENLPQLPLRANDDFGCVFDNEGKRVLSTQGEFYEIETDMAVDFAIVHAINNTYGKGINPESVPDMYNALNVVHRYLTNIGSFETAMNIQDILNKAAL